MSKSLPRQVRRFVAVWLGALALGVAFWAVVIFAALHFIAKAW